MIPIYGLMEVMNGLVLLEQQKSYGMNISLKQLNLLEEKEF
jgi:hypothetical protein